MQRPLQLDLAALGYAYHIKRNNGDRDVALSIPNNWDGATVVHLRAALDSSHAHLGQSALVSLVQNCKPNGVSTSNITIYMTCPPTPADKGMFIEQVHGRSYITYLDAHNAVWNLAPDKGHRDGIPSPGHRSPQYSPIGGHDAQWVELNNPRSWHEWANNTVPPGNTVQLQQGGLQYAIQLPPGADAAKVRTLVGAAVDAVPCWVNPVGALLPDLGLPGPPATAGTYAALNDAEKIYFDRIYLDTALALVPVRTQMQDDPDSSLHDLLGNHVSSLLVGTNGQFLAWGLNVGRQNATFHAEVSTLKDFQRRQGGLNLPPNDTRLYTSLEPCFMCSGQIVAYSAVHGLEVIFAQGDPAFGGNQTHLHASPIASRSAGDLHIWYRAGTDWSAKLGGKQTDLSTYQQTVNPQQRNPYALSTISTLSRQASFTRRFAKAGLHLAELGDALTGDLQVTGANRGFLLDCWRTAMHFLLRIGGFVGHGAAVSQVHMRLFLQSLGRYLDQTAGQNTLRQNMPGAVGATYRARVRQAGKYLQQTTTLAQETWDVFDA